MTLRTLIFALALAWTGCRTSKPVAIEVDPVPVLVPIPVECRVPSFEVPPAPVLPLDTLTRSASDQEVVRSWAASLRLLRADNKALRSLLKQVRAAYSGAGQGLD